VATCGTAVPLLRYRVIINVFFSPPSGGLPWRPPRFFIAMRALAGARGAGEGRRGRKDCGRCV